MKCPNCGEENAEEMKFCGNCGTKLPEPMNHCPNCNKDWPITLKFCGECGFKFGGGSAAGSSALMGDKNVIAGDVNNTVTNNTNNINNSTNTTYITNTDETKKVKKCHVCGSMVLITEGYECPECHEFTCSSCFDANIKICKNCADSKEKAKAAAEEQSNQEYGGYLTSSEEIELNRAKELFYNDGNFSESYEILENLWLKHKNDSTVEEAFFQVAINNKTKGAELLSEIPDNASIYVLDAAALFFIRFGDLDSAERLVNTAKKIADETENFYPNTEYNEILLNIALYKKYGDKKFLDQACEVYPEDEYNSFCDKMEQCWKIVILNELNKAKGNESIPFDKDFCNENKLYYSFLNHDIFEYYDEQ